MTFNPDVVIVGGGPIGLWTAIQIKARTQKEVLVLEKYSEYKRADINLKIQAASLKGIPNIESLKPLKELTRIWGNKTVPIKTLEDELTKCAHALGVSILKGQQVDPKTLHQDYPTTRVFIGADGAKSAVRKELFGDQYAFNTPLQYIVQAHYKIKTPTKNSNHDNSVERVKKVRTKYLQQKFAGHLITQIIRPLKNKESQVTLRIFVQESLYRKMAGATFSNPYYFEKKLAIVPKKLRNILIKWWGCQPSKKIITEVEKTNKLTVIPLASYSSKNAFVVSKNEQNESIITALVGDALQAFPFFRAINNGFLNATKLAKCVDDAFKVLDKPEKNKIKTEKSFENAFKTYSRYTTIRGMIERLRAFVKNIFITLVNKWIKTSAIAPWQTVKWSNEKVQEYNAHGKKVWFDLTNTVIS